MQGQKAEHKRMMEAPTVERAAARTQAEVEICFLRVRPQHQPPVM